MRRAIITLCGLLLTTPLYARPVTDIRFEGNNKTQERVLRQELLLRVGDETDPGRIEASRQAIMNLGLFKAVDSRIEDDGIGDRVVFRVDERYYFLPIPRLNGNLDESSISYGIALRHDNVFGLNQRFKFVYEQIESYETGEPAKREVMASYRIPRVIGTPYQLALNVKRLSEEVTEVDDSGIATGGYHLDVSSGGFFLSRWLDMDWVSTGWTVGGGMSTVAKAYHRQSGVALGYRDSQSIALDLGLNYDEVAEHPYHREGGSYGYSISIADRSIGSDYDYVRHWLQYRYYHPLSDIDANINTQLRIGVSSAGSFDAPSFSIGKSSLLRGYENGYAEGNAMLLLNLEYHHKVSGYQQLRGVIFADMGNAWASADSAKLSGMPLGLGLGLRWRVQSFVDLTLRMDYGYGVDAGTRIASLSTSASF